MTSERNPFVFHNTAIWLFLAIVFCELATYLFLFLLPNISAPPGHTYTFIHDDFLGAAIAEEGASDVSPILSPYTTKPAPPLAGYGVDIAIGKIAHVFSIPPLVAREVARITGGLVLCGSILWLITICIPKSYQSLAVILMFLIETGPNASDVFTKSITQWGTIWMNQSTLARVFGNPNDIWMQAFAIALLCCTLSAIAKPALFWIPLIIILGFVGTLSLPSYTISILLLVLLPWLLYAIAIKKAGQVFPPLLLSFIAIAASLFVTLNQISGSDQWVAYMNHTPLLSGDLTITSLFHLYSLYTPLILLFLLFAPQRWKSWSHGEHGTIVACIAWTTLPVALAYLFRFAGLPIPMALNTLYISSIPVSILSVFGFIAFTESFIMDRVRLVFTISLLAVVFGSSLLMTSIYGWHTLTESQSQSNYLSSSVWEGVFALKSLPVFSGVLALPQSGKLLPAYVSVRVFVGSQDGSDDWQARRGSALQFFSGMLDPQASYQFLKENDISYVWAGPAEQALLQTATLYPSSLQSIFQNKEVTIYKIR